MKMSLDDVLLTYAVVERWHLFVRHTMEEAYVRGVRLSKKDLMELKNEESAETGPSGTLIISAGPLGDKIPHFQLVVPPEDWTWKAEVIN